MPMTDLMIELSFCSVRFHWMLVALAVRLAAHPLARLLRCWLVDYLSFLLFFRSRASVSGNFPVSLIILLVSPSLLFSVSGCSMYQLYSSSNFSYEVEYKIEAFVLSRGVAKTKYSSRNHVRHRVLNYQRMSQLYSSDYKQTLKQYDFYEMYGYVQCTTFSSLGIFTGFVQDICRVRTS